MIGVMAGVGFGALVLAIAWMDAKNILFGIAIGTLVGTMSLVLLG